MSAGDKLLDGEKGKGMLRAAVPLTALTVNFSSMLRMAPPPVGKAMDGMVKCISGAVWDSPADDLPVGRGAGTGECPADCCDSSIIGLVFKARIENWTISVCIDLAGRGLYFHADTEKEK